MKSSFPIALVLGLALPASGMAQDWTGWYLGGHVASSRTETSAPAEAEGDGINYGIHLGYHRQLENNWVVGGEFAYNLSDFEMDNGDTVINLCRAKAIVGYGTGRWLPYAMAGIGKFRTEDLGEDFNWMAGIGLSYLLTEKYSIGAEAAFQEHRNIKNTGIDASANSLTLRASYRF